MDTTAKVFVDISGAIPVEEKVFGHFIEHIGRCVNSGVWDERSGAPAKEFGMVRKDVFDAMKALKPAVLRWPGGCFADTYRWKDGVGPEAKRPSRLNRAWWMLRPPETLFENNHFGTDEFIELCGRLGAEPYINISLGAGTPAEAAEWVEYCNGTPDTRWGAKRAGNGHEAPYNVKYWGIGNETWGVYESGYCPTGGLYALKYLAFHKKMKAADETIRAVAVGANKTYPRWNEGFLKKAARATDYLSLHEYAPGVLPHLRSAWFGYPDTQDAYYTMLAAADYFGDSIQRCRRTIEKAAGRDTNIKIAFDEWNAWWTMKQTVRAEDFTMREGLMTACALARLVRFSDILGMANFAQMVNAVGLIVTFRDGMYTTPSYQVFKLFRERTLDLVADVRVECGTVGTKKMGFVPARGDMLLLDALATLSKSGDRLSLILVNKHIDEPVSVEVSIPGEWKARRGTVGISSESPFDGNSLSDPEKVAAVETGATIVNGRLTLPPHSVTQCEFVKQAKRKRGGGKGA